MSAGILNLSSREKYLLFRVLKWQALAKLYHCNFLSPPFATLYKLALCQAEFHPSALVSIEKFFVFFLFNFLFPVYSVVKMVNFFWVTFQGHSIETALYFRKLRLADQDKVCTPDRIQNFMYNVHLYPLKDALSFKLACTKPLRWLNWFWIARVAVSLFLPPP